MKLIIMGAGYVGMALLQLFQTSNHDIYMTTTKESRIEELKPYGKEVFLLPAEESQFKEWIDSCDGMIVMVAPSHHLGDYEETYLNTAKRVATALKERKTPFYLLYTSSTSICERADNEWVTEETPLSPQSETAKLLLATEQCYLDSGVDACILRLGGIYGPKREIIDRVKRFCGNVMPGTGDEATNHSHLDDIVAGIVFCLDRRLTGIYHLVNDDHRTRKELYGPLCEQLGLPAPKWDPELKGRIGGYKISNEKIKKAGFVFTHPYL